MNNENSQKSPIQKKSSKFIGFDQIEEVKESSDSSKLSDSYSDMEIQSV